MSTFYPSVGKNLISKEQFGLLILVSVEHRSERWFNATMVPRMSCRKQGTWDGKRDPFYFDLGVEKRAPWLFRLFWGDRELPRFWGFIYFMSHYRIPVFNQPGFHGMQLFVVALCMAWFLLIYEILLQYFGVPLFKEPMTINKPFKSYV